MREGSQAAELAEMLGPRQSLGHRSAGSPLGRYCWSGCQEIRQGIRSAPRWVQGPGAGFNGFNAAIYPSSEMTSGQPADPFQAGQASVGPKPAPHRQTGDFLGEIGLAGALVRTQATAAGSGIAAEVPQLVGKRCG